MMLQQSLCSHLPTPHPGDDIITPPSSFSDVSDDFAPSVPFPLAPNGVSAVFYTHYVLCIPAAVAR